MSELDERKSELDAWKARSIFEEDMPSGVHIKGRYLDMETALMGKGFDFAVLEGITEAAAKPEKEVSDEERASTITEGLRYKRFVVCACVLEVNGEAVELTDDDYKLIPEADRDRIYKLARRSDAPLAVGV